MASVRQPIVIVGTGRCGSTLLHRLLARHEDVGWLSTFNEVFPGHPWLSVFSNLYRNSLLGDGVKHRRWFPKPFEAYRFWDHYLPGFSRRDKPLTREDVPAEGIEPVRMAVERCLRYQHRSRLLVKVTGWSRIAYFDRIFADALFVFLNREGRSVVSSWVQAGWLNLTSPIDSPEWQWGEVPDGYRILWRELGSTPILSAAVKIQLDLDDIRENMKRFPTRCCETSYENLITEPVPTLKALLSFCGLRWTPAFERYVDSRTFYDSRETWKKHLTDEQGRVVKEFFDRATLLAATRAVPGQTV